MYQIVKLEELKNKVVKKAICNSEYNRLVVLFTDETFIHIRSQYNNELDYEDELDLSVRRNQDHLTLLCDLELMTKEEKEKELLKWDSDAKDARFKRVEKEYLLLREEQIADALKVINEVGKN